MTKVEFPLFELYGKPCYDPKCRGVLVDCLEMKTKDFFRRCETCGVLFDREPSQTVLDRVIGTIGRILRGPK